MATTVRNKPAKKSNTPWGLLPAAMRVLFITSHHRTGGWLADAFAADSACKIRLEEAIGYTSGLAKLRDEVYDAVLISHEPDLLDALNLTEGMRGGGSEEPLVILGAESEQQMADLAFEAGADAYLCANTSTTRLLIWTLGRAIERQRLIHEHRRLSQAEKTRLKQEHQEIQRLLDQQRALLSNLESIQRDQNSAGEKLTGSAAEEANSAHASSPSIPEPFPFPPQLLAHYRELLRTYVIMGTGNLGKDMRALAELLAAVGLTSRQTMQLHLTVLEELVRGLGNRSSRHVMNRADLLVLEILMHLAESYRQRYDQLLHPPQQQWLPGFDGLTAPPMFAK